MPRPIAPPPRPPRIPPCHEIPESELHDFTIDCPCGPVWSSDGSTLHHRSWLKRWRDWVKGGVELATADNRPDPRIPERPKR